MEETGPAGDPGRAQRAAGQSHPFIRAKLDAAKLTPAAPATREQLIRRVTFDLIGLPPTPQEVDAFVQRHVAGRLGEGDRPPARVAALWRTLGPALARPRPLRRHQRLRVRRAAARRLALPRLRHPLASTPTSRSTASSSSSSPAIEAFPDDPDALIATGFNLLGPDMTDSADQAQRRQNTLNDMTDTAGARVPRSDRSTCARCHDHKFEPIPQTDYFRLQAFFTPAAFRRDLPDCNPSGSEESREGDARLSRTHEGHPRRDRSHRSAAPARALRGEAGEAPRRGTRRPPDAAGEARPAGNRNWWRKTETQGRGHRRPRSRRCSRPTRRGRSRT